MIGRQDEISIMKGLLDSPNAEMLAVYGRRRVGKTYLIKNVYRSQSWFDFTGTQNATIGNQLFKFTEKLNDYFVDNQILTYPKTWAEAFQLLKKQYLKAPISTEKRVIFFDEVPWIASRKSNFLEELAYWWNDWASQQNLIIVICGSAASWMMSKVINNKGGLHNRVTKKINLKPFTLAETRLFLESQNIQWDDYQIIQFYMTVGGIPSYLQEAKQGQTATQAIDKAFFSKEGSLRNEFINLYEALFDKHQNHISIIKILSEKWSGMTRQEIIAKSKFKDGGGISKILEELEASSFILKMPAFQKKSKDFVYRLIDEYSMFYLKFVEGKAIVAKNEWQLQFTNEKYKIWAGYAFENICIKHAESIKMALGISGIFTETSSYIFKSTAEQEGFQIDLLIDRADRAINLCEVKFYNDDFLVSDSIATKLRQKREHFRQITGTKKLLFNTIITTYGVRHSKTSQAQIDQIITMDKLFTMKNFE